MPSKGCERHRHDTPAVIPACHWHPNAGAARLSHPGAVEGAALWLTLEGSLTQALKARCREHFAVEVLRECFDRPSFDEARLLGLNDRELCWIREVHLRGDGQPWVLARTVIPLATLNGPGKRLRQLGRQPLGAYLFHHRRWQRGPLETGIARQAGHDPAIGRRSCFRRGSHALLVSEFFYSQLLRARPAL
ncbi:MULTISPECIES: chorismate--pyruvate lyase family protein [Marinobacter]|uniref:chorismate--pyruvate lyase family protein n=1 Tax=Marinobacter TaxID=2742 RepID=UPI000DAC1609|nr:MULTISPECIES: chorismate lyase [Marinobacter]